MSQEIKRTKIDLCLVTFGVIIGIIGVLHGSAELLKGTVLVEGHTIAALPLNWPNTGFYEMMKGAPGFSLLTGIPYYVLGLLAISISITFIVCSLTVLEVSKFGIALFTLLSVGIFCFGAGRGTPVIVSAPIIFFSILSLRLKSKQRSSKSIKNLNKIFALSYCLHIFSWVLFFPGLFVMSFYGELPLVLVIFMFGSMPISVFGALISGLKLDKTILK